MNVNLEQKIIGKRIGEGITVSKPSLTIFSAGFKTCLVFTIILSSFCVFIPKSFATVSDGFDYPVGTYGTYGLCPNSKGDSSCYWLCQDFLKDVDNNCNLNGLTTHLGEDWNRGSGYTDYGDDVHAVSNGEIVYAQDAESEWGNVIIIRHTLPDGLQVESLYGHLKDMLVTSGSVNRGQKIGTIGDGNGTTASHLHFEIRYSNCTDWGLPGLGYSSDSTGWTDPSDFIDPGFRKYSEDFLK